MAAKGLGNNDRKLIRAIETIKIRLRTVAKPDPDVQHLLAHLGLKLPSGSTIAQNVVEKNRV